MVQGAGSYDQNRFCTQPTYLGPRRTFRDEAERDSTERKIQVSERVQKPVPPYTILWLVRPISSGTLKQRWYLHNNCVSEEKQRKVWG